MRSAPATSGKTSGGRLAPKLRNRHQNSLTSPSTISGTPRRLSQSPAARTSRSCRKCSATDTQPPPSTFTDISTSRISRLLLNGSTHESSVSPDLGSAQARPKPSKRPETPTSGWALTWRFLSSGGGTRTHNKRINSPLLCQLSYPGRCSEWSGRMVSRPPRRNTHPTTG